MIRVVRISALDSLSSRMSLWWAGLSSRERWLVGILGGLLAVLVLVFGIVKPLQTARADAIADIRARETLAARVRAAGVLAPPGSQPQQRAGAPIDAAGVAAREVGLVATLAPGGAGVMAQVAEAPYETVIGWIGNVERTTVLRARRVEMTRGGAPGRVTTSVEFGQ
ncbi:type II secretion system protein M [Sphingomonas suaedae]|uniref:Type II secretion system protein M n=1 Tax=Sphingomonas suaedae TaxID=2599297 RepID=A0A518RDS1_9SPHN|nr:type II secretion system protein GspM [Sphingomonas suaedae]QDX25589.1 type II secretion system protein M [Sphingomonas suaedae]